jgi:hypothetical protein
MTTEQRLTFGNLGLGCTFTADAYGPTVFRKVTWKSAEVIDSYSPDYPVGQFRGMGHRLRVRLPKRRDVDGGQESQQQAVLPSND